MVHNCNFNKTSMLVELRRALWRIDQYKKDADEAGHSSCKGLMDDLGKDLQKHSKKLEDAITGLAKEDKFSFCDKC